MDILIAHIHHVLAPAQSWSMARCARWVRVWGWRRRKLGLDISAGEKRAAGANTSMGHHVADSESTTFTQVVEREARVEYKTAQRWVRWASLGALTLKGLQGTGNDRLRHLDALWRAQLPIRPAPSIIGPWRQIEDRCLSADGKIELRLGDSRETLPTLEAESFHGLVSDQPYGMGYEGAKGTVEGDEDPEVIASWSVPAMARVLRPNAFAVLHGCSKRLADGRYVDMVWRNHLTRAGLPMVHQAIWDKERPGPGNYLMHQHELVWVCAKGMPPQWVRGVPDVLRYPRPTDSDHPTAKPVELHERQMLLFTPPGGLVLDPFCGTGVTAVAALRTGRRYIGIEKNERWYQRAVRRVREAEEAWGGEGRCLIIRCGCDQLRWYSAE